MENEICHSPVMKDEVLKALKLNKSNIVLDCTVGDGGHSLAIAEIIGAGGTIIAFDKDPASIEAASKRLKQSAAEIRFIRASYSELKKHLELMEVDSVDAALLDLGFSHRQILKGDRGFSFMKDEDLDMRYDISAGVPVKDWLESADEEEISEIIKEYGQDKDARKIARAIKKESFKSKIDTTSKLNAIVSSVKKKQWHKTNPATKVYQALRIYINSEFSEIVKGIESCLKFLKVGGRICVLTYHSLEDRLVKDIFKKYQGLCSCPSGLPLCICEADKVRPKIKVLASSMASASEIRMNRSARSAHLRVAEVIAQ